MQLTLNAFKLYLMIDVLHFGLHNLCVFKPAWFVFICCVFK